jgi:glycosidase
MNHTSEDHEWAKAARAGDPVAKARYFFYKNWDVPNEFEKTVPQVFPTTAPGSFTWLEDCHQAPKDHLAHVHEGLEVPGIEVKSTATLDP